MLFFRAFPFSFAIMWRYLLVLPILVVAMAVFGAAAVILAFVFGLAAPFLAVVFIFAFGLASGIVPVMVGMRVGLQAHDVRPRNSYMGLMLPAIGYGFFEGLCFLIIIAVCMVLFVFTTPLDAADFIEMQGLEDAVIFATLFEATPALTIGCLVVGSCLIIALRTALMIPLAGASIGADPGGRTHTPFYGFGDGFGTMFALVLFSYIGIAMVVPIVIWLATQLGIADSLIETFAATQEPESTLDYTAYGIDGLIVIGFSLVLFLWFFSLQCAGAVLIFMRRQDDVSDTAKQRSAVQAAELDDDEPQDKTDVMDLIRSRMSHNRE